MWDGAAVPTELCALEEAMDGGGMGVGWGLGWGMQWGGDGDGLRWDEDGIRMERGWVGMGLGRG